MSSYYKVVNHSYGERLTSVIAVDEPGPTAVKTEITYEPHVWVEATHQMKKFGYHPTAFSHIDYARKFADGQGGNLEIWRCRVQDIMWDIPQTLSIIQLQVYGQIVPLKRGWPGGTIMAKKIMITERVE